MKRVFRNVLIFVLAFGMLFISACGDVDKEHTVTFDTRGGSTVSAQVVANGDVVVKPATDPTRDKFHFDGWFKDENCTQEYSFATKVTADITLYAGWTPFAKYTVTFDSKGGSEVAAQEVEEGGLVTEPTAPTRDYYEFAGWYYDFEVDGLVEERLWDFEASTVTEELTLNAHWTQTHYLLTFVTNTEVTVEPQNIEFGAKGVEPAALEKAGHTFVGWYTSSAFITKWDFETVLDQNRVLYARWYENKTIDGELDDWSAAELENYVVCRAQNNAKETRGWTLYAKYVKDAGLWISGYMDHNTVRSASTGNWYQQTNIEYKINGGGQTYLNTDGQTNIGAGIEKIMVTKAKADDGNEMFTNTYRTFWEVFYPESKIPSNVPGGPQRIGFAAATNNDKIAVGNRDSQVWWCNEGKDPNNSTNGYYVYDDAVGVADETSSKGVFVNANRSPVSGSITFNSNGGSPVTPASVQIGQKLTEPAEPTKTDYEFEGWYKDAALTAPWDFDKDVVMQSYPLYAKWTPAAQYSVTFNTNGADSATPEKLTDIWVGSTIDAPSEPTRAGYVFMGWFTDNTTFENAWVFTGGNASTVTGNITLYAKWTEIQNFTVTFESNGGTAVANQTVPTGGVVVAPANPTKTGYTFIEWCKDSGLATKWNFAADKVDENVKLYAKWYKTPDANLNDWFDGENNALYQGVSLRDKTDGKRGVDVYARVAQEGLYMVMIIRHNNATVTNKGAWYENTNAEFWIGGTQYWASMKGSGEKSANITAMKFSTAAGTDTAHVTTFEIFIKRDPSTQPVKMAFAAKADGGTEKLNIAGFTSTGGQDAWWMVSQNTVKAQTDSNITFSGLNGTDDKMQFYVYDTGIHMTQKP